MRPIVIRIVVPLVLLFGYINCQPFDSATMVPDSISQGSSSLSCAITASPLAVTAGQPVVLIMAVAGSPTQVSLNGVSLPISGGSLTVTPGASGTFSGQVIGSGGSASCASPSITVTPVGGSGPTCTITSGGSNIVPGDSVTLTMATVGSITLATLNGQTVNNMGTTISITPLTNTVYTGKVSGPGGSGTCAFTQTVKATNLLTKVELFRAKVGPGGLSIDDLLTRPNSCMQCHTSGTPLSGYALAPSYLVLNSGDVVGNLTRIRNIKSPSGNKIGDGDLATSGDPVLTNFMTGHKSSGHYSFSSAEISHAQAFINRP